MPTISLFYGIVVTMYPEKNKKHNKPHVHARYSGKTVVVDLNGEVLEGEFPKAKLHLLQAWIHIHEEDLNANWELLLNGESTFRIEPLK